MAEFKDTIAELLELSDVLASHIAKAMEQLPEQDRSFSLAMVTFHRMSAYAALCMGLEREHYLRAAADIYDGSKKAADIHGMTSPPMKH